MIRFNRWIAFIISLSLSSGALAVENELYIPKSKAEAEATIERANTGDPEAQYRVGMTYRLDKKNAESMKQGIEWIRKAADQNYAPAQNTLGMLYANGNGVPKNEKTGFEWVKKAADQNEATAQYNLAIMYFAGIGAKANDAMGVTLLKKAAAQGQPDAQLALGDLMRQGEAGVPQDRTSALAMYKKAADSGLPEAMYRYGIAMGEDKTKRSEAIVWINRAANSGFSEAQFMVGILAYNPEGETHDRVTAYQWFTLVATRADDEMLRNEAKGALAELEKEMSPEQIKEGKARVAKWQPITSAGPSR